MSAKFYSLLMSTVSVCGTRKARVRLLRVPTLSQETFLLNTRGKKPRREQTDDYIFQLSRNMITAVLKESFSFLKKKLKLTTTCFIKPAAHRFPTV